MDNRNERFLSKSLKWLFLFLLVILIVFLLAIFINTIHNNLESTFDAETSLKPSLSHPTNLYPTTPTGLIVVTEGEQGCIHETQQTIENTIVQQNDPYETAKKYQRINNVSKQAVAPASIILNGAVKKFWILNVDSNEYRQSSAKLVYQTEHLYFWIEEGVDYSLDDAAALSDTFENRIYPTNRDIFGAEWSPGIDNDDHLTILFAKNLGGAAGYFSSVDSLNKQIEPYSNEAEMFYLSADFINLGENYAYSVLAHEFQHMIHWNIDRNESSWINEGLSEFAVEINNYSTGGFTHVFAANPDLQLNFWPGNDQGSATPHYGSSYLFIKYLSERFGIQAVKELVQNQENGMASFDAVLHKYMLKNGINPAGKLGDQFFQDWTIDNFLGNGVSAETENIPQSETYRPNIPITEEIRCDGQRLQGDVHQYGADYIEIVCDQAYEIKFSGNEFVPIMPVSPHDGDYYVWSNKGDESIMRITRDFDFTNVSPPIELSYWVWFDIERDYDYLYLNIMEKGGDWKNVISPSCSTLNSTGSNLGCGYNGLSGEWKNEIVDLSVYAGKAITVEFEYITDASVNGEGFLLDDIEIQALDYEQGFEEGLDEWGAEGFVRIKNELPQTFAVATISLYTKNEIHKEIISETFSKTIEKTDRNSNEVLVVSGLTRFTNVPANYQIEILPLGEF